MKSLKLFQSRTNDRRRDLSRLIVFPMYLLSIYFIIISVEYIKINNNVIRNNSIIRLFIYFLLFFGTQLLKCFFEDLLRKILGKRNLEIEKETWTLVHIIVFISFLILVSISNN